MYSRKTSATTTLLVLSVCTVSIKGEDFGQSFSHTTNGSNNAGNEVIITMAFSAFLAFCILSADAAICYFCYLEDKLMKRYLEEGGLVHAAVVAADFARGGNANPYGKVSSDRLEREYVLFVEYNCPIEESSYMARIRKQIKAKEADIKRTDHFSYRCEGYEDLAVLDSPIQVRKMLQMFHDDENGIIKNQGLGTVEMLVMPHFHKSGILKPHVERVTSRRHRTSMAALITSGVGLALFCARLTAKAISSSGMNGQIGGGTNLITAYMMGIFSILVLFQMLLLHFCLHKALVGALENEYLNSGEMVPLDDEDDSSLSTGSDAFLGRNLNTAFVSGGPVMNGGPFGQNLILPGPRLGRTGASCACPIPTSVDV